MKFESLTLPSKKLGCSGNQIPISLDRRSHNPIIAQASLDRDSRSIPWLGGKRLCFDYKERPESRVYLPTRKSAFNVRW